MTTEKKIEALKICNKIIERLITDEKVSICDIRKLETLLENSASKVSEPAVQYMDNGDLEKKITDYLKDFGISAHLKGYAYIRYALMYLYRIHFQSNKTISVTYDLYPAVATEFETTSKRVERAIRNAIDVSWKHCNSEIKSRMFRSHPTNSQFLYTLVDELLMNS